MSVLSLDCMKKVKKKISTSAANVLTRQLYCLEHVTGTVEMPNRTDPC